MGGQPARGPPGRIPRGCYRPVNGAQPDRPGRRAPCPPRGDRSGCYRHTPHGETVNSFQRLRQTRPGWRPVSESPGGDQACPATTLSTAAAVGRGSSSVAAAVGGPRGGRVSKHSAKAVTNPTPAGPPIERSLRYGGAPAWATGSSASRSTRRAVGRHWCPSPFGGRFGSAGWSRPCHFRFWAWVNVEISVLSGQVVAVPECEVAVGTHGLQAAQARGGGRGCRRRASCLLEFLRETPSPKRSNSKARDRLLELRMA